MAQIEAVQSYRTADGKVFATKREALMHTHREAYRKRAEEFADSVGLEGATKTRAVNIVIDYCAFEELADAEQAEAA